MIKLIMTLLLLLTTQMARSFEYASEIYKNENSEIKVYEAVGPEQKFEMIKAAKFEILNEEMISDQTSNGFRLNDVKVVDTSEGIEISNYSPRSFNEVVLSDGVDAYLLDIELLPRRKINIALDKNINDLVFLDPNNQFESSPLFFDQSVNSVDKNSYELVLNHLKCLYSKEEVKERFFNTFMNENYNQALSIEAWYKLMTYNVPKEYKARQGLDSSSATQYWLSINWLLDVFNQNKDDTRIYADFSRASAITLGENSSDILVNEWPLIVEDLVKNAKDEGSIESGKLTKESSNLYAYYNSSTKSLKIFVKEGVKVDKIQAIGKAKSLEGSGVQDGRFLLNPLEQTNDPVLVSIYGDDNYFSYVIDNTDLSTSENTTINDYITIGDRNFNIEDELIENYYYFIPAQDSVVYTDSIRSTDDEYYNKDDIGKYTNIKLYVKNLENGTLETVKVKGSIGDKYAIDNSANDGGGLHFSLVEESLDVLPDGRYSGVVLLNISKFPADDGFKKQIRLKVDFSKYNYNSGIKNNVWSRNYSSETPSGNSSVYFYIENQPKNVVSSTGPRNPSKALWSGANGKTNIQVKVRGDDGKEYSLDVFGQKKFGNKGIRMEDGVQRGYGQMKIALDKYNYSYYNLPKDQFYRGNFIVTADGWHDSNYSQIIPVDLSFFSEDKKKNADFLKLDEWSKNYSQMTPSGNSSVYFYIDNYQDNAIESNGPRRPSQALWSGSSGKTSIKVKVESDDGEIYQLDLIGYKKFGNRNIKMEDGVQRGYGQMKVVIDYDSESYINLPNGKRYQSEILIIAKGWHDSTFEKSILVDLDFDK
ncbi:hypothetical protein [Vibrio mediterranei]|uniref:hypothetical protein n=1 Tax=Vibrio mediterranei TaxID=689 RepID=UPI00148DF552|nr:hypothetical protein [Vibrio mediterranei]NOH31407.1 hypothetical protein [Vibrio mediterranei]